MAMSSHVSRGRRILSIGAILLLLFCVQRTAGTEDHRPRLAIVIVVDQMRADYLSRYASLYTGGLARLMQTGIVFTQAYHNHAATETAVGHATISTGCYPAKHGIVGNGWYDQERQKTATAVGDSTCPVVGGSGKGGASPHNLQRPALGDWLKAGSPQSKVYSIALKDRSAILMGGRHPDGAFWYDRTAGDYVTSTYYADTLATTVAEFDRRRQVDSFRMNGWLKLLPDSAYSLSHADSFTAENDGIQITFPHLFDSLAQPKDYYTAFYGTPFADRLTLKLAEDIAHDAQLGYDSIPDLLWISCSAADAIGHQYGPNSQEAEDYYIRLDQYLDTFFTALDSEIGPEEYLVVLTADHAAMTMPEDLAAQGIKGGRMALDSAVKWTKAAGDSAAAELHLAANPIVRCDYEIYLDYSEARAKGIDDSLLQQTVAGHVRRLPFIAGLFTAHELAKDSIPPRPFLDLFKHNYHAVRRPDIYLMYPENCLVDNDPHGTSHGTPYDYDRHVSLIVAGSGIAHRTDSTTVFSVDIAPTIARLLGVTIPVEVDGRPLL